MARLHICFSPPARPSHPTQVKRARNTSEKELRNKPGGMTLSLLGFNKAHAFQGPSSRNPDGTERHPHRDLAVDARRDKPARRRPTPAPVPVAAPEPVEEDPLSRRGIIGGALGEMFKRRRLASARYHSRGSRTFLERAWKRL